MLVKNVLCTKCFQIVNGIGVNYGNKKMKVGYSDGNQNTVYLYIPLEEITSLAQIKHAELSLYKVENRLSQEIYQYKIITTEEYINPYVTVNYEQLLYETSGYVYWISNNSAMITLDITKIISDWITLGTLNRGMILTLAGEEKCSVFAGLSNPMTAPFIQILYSLTGEQTPAYLEESIRLGATVKIKGGDNG